MTDITIHLTGPWGEAWLLTPDTPEARLIVQIAGDQMTHLNRRGSLTVGQTAPEGEAETVTDPRELAEKLGVI